MHRTSRFANVNLGRLAPSSLRILCLTMAGALLLWTPAQAQPVSVSMTNQVPVGKKPSLTIRAATRVTNLVLELTRREDDSKLSVKIPALGAGQTRVIPIGDGAIGAATYDGTLTLQHAGDDSWVAGINMETKVNSEIRVGYQREHLYLDRHVLEFQI